MHPFTGFLLNWFILAACNFFSYLRIIRWNLASSRTVHLLRHISFYPLHRTISQTCTIVCNYPYFSWLYRPSRRSICCQIPAGTYIDVSTGTLHPFCWLTLFHVFAAHQIFGSLYIFKQVAWDTIQLSFESLLWGLGTLALDSNRSVCLGHPVSCSSVSLIIGMFLSSLYFVQCPPVLGTRPPDLGKTVLTSFPLLDFYLLR